MLWKLDLLSVEVVKTDDIEVAHDHYNPNFLEDGDLARQ